MFISLLTSILNFLIAFLIAPLPDEIKKRMPFSPYRRLEGQVTSAVAEILVAGFLYWLAYMRAMEEFTAQYLDALTADSNQTHSLNISMGAVASLAFMFTPKAIVLMACAVEGIPRVLETTHDVYPGCWLIALPWRLWNLLTARFVAKRELLLLGPERPDELLGPEKTGGAVEIYAARRKDYSPVQALEFGGQFFILESAALIPWRDHQSWRYRFRPMKQGEIIRTTLIRFEE